MFSMNSAVAMMKAVRMVGRISDSKVAALVAPRGEGRKERDRPRAPPALTMG
jgi:hypothetical protein